MVALPPPMHAARQYVADALGLSVDVFTADRPPNPTMGDVAVGCFAAAKALGKPPAQVASELAAQFAPSEWLAAATAAGPFLNFRLQRARTYDFVIGAARDGALVPQALSGQTICIDYSSPNISKHLAYHHIRSTVIGHALVQIFRALGARVVGINHLGDWGTTHGMLLAGMARWGIPDPLDISALNALYVKFRESAKADPILEVEARHWFARLEAGDPAARATWQLFRDVSWQEFATLYAQLGIVFDEVRGESAYEDELKGVLEEYRAKGLLTESEGAQVVVLPDEKTPLLLATKDGTTLYATRDVAAAKYRYATYQFARSLYVVDRGQALHFRQLFKALAAAGYSWAGACEHVPFGLVRIGGKKTGTRTGNVVLLRDVLREAEAEIRERVATKHDDMPSDEVTAIARAVGYGAVVFANLAPQRDKDVDFDWDRALSTEGDSGPYIQYTHARCAAILRKESATTYVATLLTSELEWNVARVLLDFGDVVERAGVNCEPHLIAHYLLRLAGEFSRWYTAGNGDPQARVLCDDAPTRHARLALVDATRATLAQGLALLGLRAPPVL